MGTFGDEHRDYEVTVPLGWCLARSPGQVRDSLRNSLCNVHRELLPGLGQSFVALFLTLLGDVLRGMLVVPGFRIWTLVPDLRPRPPFGGQLASLRLATHMSRRSVTSISEGGAIPFVFILRFHFSLRSGRSRFHLDLEHFSLPLLPFRVGSNWW